jgi:hypothetical protein
MNHMKPRDVFKIIVATVGLVLICMGVVSLISAVVAAMSSMSSPLGSVFGRLAAVAAMEMIVGVLIMKGYPPFVDIAFPLASSSPDSAPVEKRTQAAAVENGPPCVSCGKPMPEGSKMCPSCGWTQPT